MAIYERHPLSAVYENLTQEVFEDLVEGLRIHQSIDLQPIIRYEGKILDGWQRYKACLAAKLQPVFKDYRGKDPVDYVLRVNNARRHLSPEKLALTAEIMYQKYGGKPKSAAKQAHDLGVSKSTVDRARKVVHEGSSALQAAALAQDIALKEAAEIARQPKKEQPKAIRKAVREPKPVKVMVPKEQYDTLEQKYSAQQETIEELAAELETYTAVEQNEHHTLIANLRRDLALAQARRGELMNENAELHRQCAFYQRELKKLGWEPVRKVKA